MKRTKLVIGTMILGLGMAGAAWAQPAPDHDRNGNEHRVYSTDRGDVNRGRGDRDDVYRGGWNGYEYKRGDGDHDRDDRVRGDRDDRWHNDRDARGSWNWEHSKIRRNDRDNW